MRLRASAIAVVGGASRLEISRLRISLADPLVCPITCFTKEDLYQSGRSNEVVAQLLQKPMLSAV